MLQKEYYAKLELARQKQDALQHHGIIGQRWGVRRFQEKDGSYTQAGRERYGYGPPREKKNDDDENDEKIGIMSTIAISLAAMAGITVAEIPIAAGMDAIHDAKVSKDIKNWEANRATEETDPKTGLKLKSNPDSTLKEDMKMINRAYGYGLFKRATILNAFGYESKKAMGHTENCMLCTTALDIKRRGYDVKAGDAESGYYASDLKNWYKEKKEPQRGNYKDIVNQLKNEPEGSHGNLMVYWAEGGGHSMFYQIEKGKPVIYDAQSNRKYNINYIMAHVNTKSSGHCFLRTDDLTPDYEYLKEHNMIG